MSQVFNAAAAAQSNNNGNLTFTGVSYTPEEFKQVMGCDSIQVFENKPGHHKAFFACTCVNKSTGEVNEMRGAVSTKGIPTKKPMFSEVQGEDGEPNWFILHEDGREEPAVTL